MFYSAKMKSLLFACVSFAFLASVIFAGGTQNSLRCFTCVGFYQRSCEDPFDNITYNLYPSCAQCSKASVEMEGKMYIERKCLETKSGDDGCKRNATHWECLCSDESGCNGRNSLVPEGAAYSVAASASVVMLSANFVMQLLLTILVTNLTYI
ncbi:uncharacterized protein LOC128241661 [Mya arenaria]|uniref:uncharacterized protein LOC128241661 n=1 Tax=Mya arenaria TaxID=6604 RepID=UPI0022E3A889|nr:uncharacterized protein LOC128241661 [Mya arenaria]